MAQMGFLISSKPGERRRALLPEQVRQIAGRDELVFECGYGGTLGIPDSDYLAAGARVGERQQVLACKMLVDVKLADADYLGRLGRNKLLIGWAHAVQKLDFTSACILGGHSVLAWEEIFEDGRYLFWKNRELAGQAAILHAFRYCGKLPCDTRVAVIGNGQTARGAVQTLRALGARTDVFGRSLENSFKQLMYDYDVIVNCVLWDTSRTDHLICREDLKRMKLGTLIIDVSCDPHLEIETSHATTIENPVYTVDGVIHYAVDNTPALFPVSASRVISEGFAPYVDAILEGKLPPSLEKAVVIRNGGIQDERIRMFRKARGLFCELPAT